MIEANFNVKDFGKVTSKLVLIFKSMIDIDVLFRDAKDRNPLTHEIKYLSKRRQYDGQIALGYVAWYGLGRAMIEGLRMDSLYWGSRSLRCSSSSRYSLLKCFL